VIQVGLAGIPPFSGVSLRFILAALILFVLARIRGVQLGRRRHEVRLWLVNGIFGFTVSYGVVYWAEQWVPSSLASVLFATYPLIVAVLVHLIIPEERLGRIEALGVLIGFSGVAVIFSSDFEALGGRDVMIGAAVILLSPAAAAIASVTIKRWGGHIHAFSHSAVPMAITGVLTGLVAAGFEREREFHFTTTAVSALVYLAVFGTVVTFTVYYWLLAHLPAKRLSLIAYVIPVVAVCIGLFRGEPFTPQIFGGAALVVGGVWLALRR